MISLRAVLACALVLLGAIPIASNLITPFVARRAGQSVSMVPLVGGILGAAGMMVLPIAGVRNYAWLPLLLDISIPLTVVFGLQAGWKAVRHGR